MHRRPADPGVCIKPVITMLKCNNYIKTHKGITLR